MRFLTIILGLSVLGCSMDLSKTLEPKKAKSADAEPSGVEEPGKRKDVDPVPGDPVPGDPVPGDPVPGDPVPGDPVPGDPVPGGPAEASFLSISGTRNLYQENSSPYCQIKLNPRYEFQIFSATSVGPKEDKTLIKLTIDCAEFPKLSESNRLVREAINPPHFLVRKFCTDGGMYLQTFSATKDADGKPFQTGELDAQSAEISFSGANPDTASELELSLSVDFGEGKVIKGKSLVKIETVNVETNCVN